nr:branched-chain amino acid ABC transporter permease [Bradyrhizobium pachyrhizi]
MAPLSLGDRYANLAIRMLIAGLFASAFNLLWRQARLLSFGHAVYFGAGMFAVVHLMRANEAGLNIPLVVVPLAGAICGLVIGIMCGFVATLRSGAYFSMITLAIAELVYSLGPRWQALFGGEAGISSMRLPSMGLSFATLNQVYLIVLLWCAVGFVAIWFFAKTPLGQIAFALGDNEQRLRFLGYRTHAVKVCVFAISAAISGLAGGLLGIAAENVDYTVFGPASSAAPVIHTFIGGADFLLGPAFGAALLTGLGNVFSDVTRLWPLYQGTAFVLVVLFLPAGLVGAVALGKQIPPRKAVANVIAVLLCSCSLIFLCETASILLSDSYLTRRAAQGGAWVDYRLFNLELVPSSPLVWALPLLVALAGIMISWKASRGEEAA